MKKKGIIVLSSVVGMCALALVLSSVLDWSVDTQNTSGNIGKSSRFSRKTAEVGLSNMEELLLNDENYKNSMVSSYFIMQTRAEQFNSLVNLSNEVAGDIPEFSAVLKDMNDIRPMINNVSASLAQAGQDLNASLGGESRPDLAQNTINASLAYTTLQKQNTLANRFINTTDEYLKKAEGSDELKFVRDQWMNYQHMSAALENDTKSAEELKAKGYQLTPEQSAAALCSFDGTSVFGLVVGDCIAQTLDIENSMAAIFTHDALGHIFDYLNHTHDILQLNTGDNLNMNTKDRPSLSFGEQMVNFNDVILSLNDFTDILGAQPKEMKQDLTLGFGGQILELAGGHVTLSL